jgi:peptidoglycan/LPS O-acetylase OafA/YrhL
MLDVLRAVAVLLVIGHHLTLPSVCSPILRAWHCAGWIGVDLFFVLSGFLVSGLLFREFNRCGSVKLGSFLARRGLKIYPAFYFFLATTVFAIVVRGRATDWEVTPRTIASECFFTQNYLSMIWGHTWSLAVEEHFYLGLGLLVMILIRVHRTSPFACIPWMFVTIAVLDLGWRIANTQRPFNFYSHLGRTHLRVDSLFFGVLLSYWYHFAHSSFSAVTQRLRIWLVLCSIAFAAPAFVWNMHSSPWLAALGPTLLYLSGGAILSCLVVGASPPGIVLRGIAAIGTYSYSIYLWHMPVLAWVVPLVQRHAPWTKNEWVYALVACALSIGVGIVLSLLIEAPVLRIRDRWLPSRSN